MNKAWTITLKDTLIRFRDRTGLLFNLVAPLLLAAIMGSAFGNFGGDDPPIADIPIILVNADEGELGETFAGIFAEDGLAELVTLTEMDDLDEAIAQVEAGETRVVIYLPPDFSDVMSVNGGEQPVELQLYTDPAATVSPQIVTSIVEQIVISFNQNIIASQVAIQQLTVDHAPQLGAKLANFGQVMNETFGNAGGNPQTTAVNIATIVQGADETEEINLMAFFVPSMAIFFLMFAMMDGARTILDERNAGTLDRLLATPTSTLHIVLGKVGGTMLTGILQMSILVVASALLFGLDWGGSPVAVGLLILATALAAASLGTFIAAFGKQPVQTQIVGTAVSILFGMIGGNFIQASALPDWMQPISKLTLNRWAMDGFTDLSFGRVGVTGILPHVGVLLAMSLIFLALGVWSFRRQLER